MPHASAANSAKGTEPMIKMETRAVRLNGEAVCRVLPFALFMAFIAIQDLLSIGTTSGWLALPQTTDLYLYPLRALSVGALLYWYRGHYRELRIEELREGRTTAAVALTGLFTFLLWISLDGTLPVTPHPSGFRPDLLPEGPVRMLITAIRVAGSVLVVPVMEELFWRSFLLRYLVRERFLSVPIGAFSWRSFLLTTLLFGLEHHQFWAGMAAGAIYNLVCYKTRSIAQCILAHAVTNLALGCYVLYTGKWYFW